jgi:hypothetical protein
MIANNKTKTFLHKLPFACAALLAMALTANAQVQSSTTVAKAGPVRRSTVVEKGTVVYISGNNLIVKAEDGTLRHFSNVPDSVTVTVDGKQLNVHQLQVGMTVERQTITTTVPKLITTVKTVTGTIKKIDAPKVVLTLADGSEQSFTIPAGQMFNVNGEQKGAKALRKGMIINAQQVIEVPSSTVSQQVIRTGVAPPPPPAPDVPILVVYMPAPPPPAEVAEATPAALPKTASDMPLVGLVGGMLLTLGLGLTAARTYRA